MAKQKYMTEAQLERLCRKWQKILRLQDWTISVFFACLPKGNNGNYIMGSCDADSLRKAADIKILNTSLWEHNEREPGWRGLSKEIELTLIHELLHCHFRLTNSPKEGTEDYLIMENGVESLAVAFLDNVYNRGRE